MMDLEAIKARLAAATPGPWLRCGDDRGGCTCGMVFAPGVDQHVATSLTANDEGMPCPDEATQRANAALIAHAPQDLADLLAALNEEKARTASVLDRLREARAPVPYRRGLPSRAVLNAHDANGSRWLRRVGDQIDLIEMSEMTEHDMALAQWAEPHEAEYAPCLADGKACDWPEVPTP